MRVLRFAVLTCALAVLTASGVTAAEHKLGQVVFDDVWSAPEVSGVFNPMRLSTQDVNWDGSGSVSVPFTINQRATVWLIVYRIGSSETGATGPNGAVLRLVPQDLFVATTAGQAFESGSNSITWDGMDWEGNAAGPGDYEFDVLGINNLDKPTLAGPSSNEFTKTLIDTRSDPPDIWVQTSDREKPGSGETLGDVVHATLGTDYIANPRAWERWSYTNIFGFEGPRTIGGMRVDDEDQEIFWVTHRDGEFGGLYKVKINPAARSWDRVTDFGDNGFSANANGPRITEVEPFATKGIVYTGLWGQQDVPFCLVESRDKTTGEIITEFDVTDFYLRIRMEEDGTESIKGVGPGHMDINEHGIWMTSWANSNVVRMDHNGEVQWVNGLGDILGDDVTFEVAAELGIQPASGSNIQIRPDISGNVAFMTHSGNDRGSQFSAFGRDGTGLFDVFFSATIGPFQPSRTWHLSILDENGPYDGFYYGTGLSPLGGASEDGTPRGPGELIYIPYDLASASMGSGITTAVSQIEGTPDAASLSPAYPNPFNPETTIQFTVAGTEHVKVGVYNAAGQKVATLADEELNAGVYKTVWDGRDQHGVEVSSGVYYYRMQAGTFIKSGSVTFVK